MLSVHICISSMHLNTNWNNFLHVSMLSFPSWIMHICSQFSVFSIGLSNLPYPSVSVLSVLWFYIINSQVSLTQKFIGLPQNYLTSCLVYISAASQNYNFSMFPGRRSISYAVWIFRNNMVTGTWFLQWITRQFNHFFFSLIVLEITTSSMSIKYVF